MRIPIPQLTHSHRAEPVANPPWTTEIGDRFNVASYLPARAAERPDQLAIVMPAGYDELGKRLYSHLTFAQLDRLCDAYAHGLVANGLEPGDRVLLMVRQGLELIALTFALFKVGACPVLIDPGMGVKSFLGCVEQCQPNAMVGIPLAHVIRIAKRKAFRSVTKPYITQPKWFTGAPALSNIARFDDGPFAVRDTESDELAAILFTSGSTGPPKGVRYTHRIFGGQTRAIQEMYGIEPGETCVPAFPLFALFSTAMGMTCVVPDFDPKSPATIDPANVVEAVCDYGADMAFGSPAVWKRVQSYCEETVVNMPSLSRVLMFGAPISPLMMEAYRAILPNGAIYTPYGATESLPVASISSDTVLGETAEASKSGKGICVGNPVPNATVRIIAIDDEPIETWADATEVEPGTIGEICVTGGTVTPGYYERPEHDALSKIRDASQPHGFWHRMGDVGYLDEQGRIWFCGRKSHRVVQGERTHFTVPCEAIFNNHPEVYRSALVGLGRSGDAKPAIVVELEGGKVPNGTDAKRLTDELLELGRANPLTDMIEDVLFHPGFPVDKRHNAKIHRGELAEWAGRQLG
jgi:acyl-CoA synthetase (AMP-forming)/AMP-acid ligase II